MNNVLFYSCRSAYSLAKQVCENLKQPIQTNRSFGFFDDSEMKVRFHPELPSDFLKDRTVVLFACPRRDTQEHWMETFGTMFGLVYKKVKEIVPIFFFLGYRRQDIETKPGEVPLLGMIPQFLSTFPIKDIVIGEIHNEEVTQGLFKGYGINIHEVTGHRAFNTICGPLLQRDDTILASPDKGRLMVLQRSATEFGREMISSEKKRPVDDHVDVMTLDQIDLKGKTVLIRDDEVNTFRTMSGNIAQYKQRGAEKIIGFSVHGIFSGDAVDLIHFSGLERLYVSTTITFPYEKGLTEAVNQEEVKLGMEFRCDNIYFYSLALDFATLIKQLFQSKNFRL